MHNKLNLEADGLQQQKTTLSAKNGKLRLQNWKNTVINMTLHLSWIWRSLY